MEGIDVPFYAGGGVFSWQAAAKLIMAGSQCVQLGTLACCNGPRAVSALITDLEKWMNQAGYEDMDALYGEALQLFTMPKELSAERTKRLGEAYTETMPDQQLCNGCCNCVDACWYDSIEVKNGKAVKSSRCIGCGYCFQVCPTGALEVDAGEILCSVFD
jgi:dihydropyrimidine dehydrogenase (NAD+) subunit PreA